MERWRKEEEDSLDQLGFDSKEKEVSRKLAQDYLASIEVNDILNIGFHIHVGSRENTSFWNDIWCD